MSTSEKLTRSALKQTSELLGEPVLEAAFVNRHGTLGAIVASTALRIVEGGHGSRAVPPDEIQRVDGEGTALPHAFLLAITASRVHVFAMRIAMCMQLKVKEELGSFDRADLKCVAHDTPMTTVFRLHSPSQGQAMTFEIVKSDYSHDVAAYLAQPADTQPAAPAGPTIGVRPPTQQEREGALIGRAFVWLFVLLFLAGNLYTVYIFFGRGPAA